MKKSLLIILLLGVLATLGLSYTLGICAQNWSGHVDCCKYHGVYVSSTVSGYIADGVLRKGDVITEAIAFPVDRCCNPCCNPCCEPRPCCGDSVSDRTFTFNPDCSLSSQRGQLDALGECCHVYKKTWNRFALADILDYYCPGATIVMRVYRTTTCQWMIATLTRDPYGNPVFSLYPRSRPKSPQVSIVVESEPVTPYTIEIIIQK